MPHDTPLITTIVAALVLAYIFGAIANRLKMPPLVGYLIAGVCVGPHSPGFVADQTLAPQLAEIGVILLMFGVGLEFSLRDLLSVRAVAIPGAVLRLAVATSLGVGLGLLLGWPLLGGVVFGLALGVSSTVVTLKAMQERHLVDSDRGRIAIGWLVVEDLIMVLALVLIPALAGPAAVAGAAHAAAAGAAGLADAAPAGSVDPFVRLTEELLHTHLPLWGVLVITLVKLLAFVGFMIVVGRRIIPFILHATAHTGSRELFRLAVLAIALGVAAGAAYLFGVSLALGAFFAGMILSESELSHRAAQETLPLRDAFGVLFFVSVGMLFDPSIFVRQPLPVLAALVIILFGKSIVGFLLLVLFRRPVSSALTITAALAQIGEFSFILAALGISLGVMPEEARGLILAGAIISIILNPLMFWVSERLRARLEARAPRRAEPDLGLGPVVPDHVDDVAIATAPGEEVLEETAHPTRLSNHVVLIGYGRVGGVVAEELLEEGAPFLLIEDAEGRVLAARAAGIEVIVANAATREALTLANVMGARCVVIAIPNAFEAGQAVEQCRKLNAGLRIIARAHSDEEVDYLKHLGADKVIMGEREIGLGMVGWLKHDGRAATAESPEPAPEEDGVRTAGPATPAEPPTVAGPATAAEPVVAAEPAEPAAAIVASAVPVEFDAPAPVPPLVAEESAPTPFAAPPHVVESILPPAVPSVTEPKFQVPDDASALAAIVAAAEPAIAASATVTAAPRSVPGLLEPEILEAEILPVDTVEPMTAEPPVAPADSKDFVEAGAPVGRGAEDPIAAQPTEPEAAVPTRAPVNGAAEPPRPSPGFKVVPPSDIIILPPDPAARNSAKGAVEAQAEDGPVKTFRSQFWDDPVEGAPFAAAPIGASGPVPPLRDVRDAEAARAAVEDGAWMAALERDLFGEKAADPGTPPNEDPAPVPQPIETPQPNEDPVPAPQPIETPRPQEDPQPAPQPIETPVPQEIPGAPAPAPAQPVSPPAPTAARGNGSTAEATDAYGRKEPHLY